MAIFPTSAIPSAAAAGITPSEHFNTVLYTGNGSTNAITGVGFQPDFFWGKARSASQSHRLVDVLRGSYNLYSDLTNAEDLQTLSFTSDGFTWAGGGANDNGKTYVAWNWKAGGTGVSNTNGSITSTVSANADAGFSIVSYTGTASTITVGHGLSSKPEMIIVKKRDAADHWAVMHKGIASDYETDFINLNQTAAAADTANYWNDTEPTNSLFTLGNQSVTNSSSKAYIAYCFHSVDGYSKVGSYTGNGGNFDAGPFIYTGFRPAYILIKSTGFTTDWTSWAIFDSARSPDNESTGQALWANKSAAEGYRGNGTSASTTNPRVDLLSNGFKIRTHTNGLNYNGSNYIYLAFAESPMKHTNAR